MKIPTSYPDVLANMFQSAKAWRSVALLMIVVFLLQTVMLLHIASQRTVLLVPQALAAGKAGISLNLGEPFNPDYMTAVAKGDAYSLLSWTPDNVEDQYGLFLARLTAASYDTKREALLAESKAHKDDGLTQSFYIARSFVTGADVTLHGVLVRSMGGKEVFRGPAAYTFSYENVGNGMVNITGVHQPSDQEYHAIQESSRNKKAVRAAK